MKNLELSDEEAAALVRLLNSVIDSDHYPLSPPVQMLQAIRAKLRRVPGPASSLAGAENLRAKGGIGAADELQHSCERISVCEREPQ